MWDRIPHKTQRSAKVRRLILLTFEALAIQDVDSAKHPVPLDW